MNEWVYDQVCRLADNEIVALLYHVQLGGEEHPDCLMRLRDQLADEGLYLHRSGIFPSLETAKQSAWENKQRFAKDLD